VKARDDSVPWQRDSPRRRFGSSYSTTSGCGTTSAGRCSTAESASGASTAQQAMSGRREPGSGASAVAAVVGALRPS